MGPQAVSYILFVLLLTLDLAMHFTRESLDASDAHFWTPLAVYLSLLGLQALGALIARRRPSQTKLRDLLCDGLLFMHFTLITIPHIMRGLGHFSALATGQFYLLFTVFQQFIESHFIKTLVALPTLLFAIIQLNSAKQDRIPYTLQISFLLAYFFVQILINYSKHSRKSDETLQGEKNLLEFDLMKSVIEQNQIGLAVYDHQLQCKYINEFAKRLENLQQSKPALDLLSPKREENCSLKDPTSASNSQKSSILDLHAKQQTPLKRHATIKQLLLSIDVLDLDGHEYTVTARENLAKVKFKLKLEPITAGGQSLILLIFNEILRNSTKTEVQKFRQHLMTSFAHKLKTPLHAVLSYLEAAIRDKTVSPSLIEQYLRPSLFNSKLQLYLIQDVLDYVGEESFSKNTLKIKNVNLVQLMSDLNDLLSIQCQQKQIELVMLLNNMTLSEAKSSRTKVTLNTDENKLTRVLVNLLNNAYRFTKMGGQIRLEVTEEYQSLGQRQLSFAVKDTGIGIGSLQIDSLSHQISSYQEKVIPFQPRLQRSDRSIRSEYVGISLKLAAKIITLLNKNGQLSISSTEQVGSTFSFELYDWDLPSTCGTAVRRHRSPHISEDPVEEPAEQESRACLIKNMERARSTMLPLVKQSVVKASSFRAYRASISKSRYSPSMRCLLPKKASRNNLCDDLNVIVIVDDEPFNHISLEMMLKGMGYNQIEHCYNGHEVVELFQKRKGLKVKAVLMDVDMPVMNGIEATQILMNEMELERIPQFPIIACTAHEDEETKEKCLESGMSQIVVKPIFPAVLQEALSELTGSSKQL